MKYPIFLSDGDTIGVTAPSDGNRKEVDFLRLEYARKALEREGYRVLETSNVRTSEGGRSGSAFARAAQFMELIRNSEVKSIVSAKGGDFLMEILPLLSYETIEKNEKWIQGFSDNTGLLFTITVLCDVATMYSNHFNDFAMQPWHESIVNNINMLQGKDITQKSFDTYEDGFYDRVTGLEEYHKDKKVCWQSSVGNQATITGRMLGGCLDVLLNLVGTKYDKVKEFVSDYKEDGIVWYLESFSLDAESITRGLWQLKEAGWFEHATGFVFGRPCMFESFIGYSYEEAVMSVLDPLLVPVIFDADVGHKAPQFTVVNGAIGTWEYKDGKGSLKTELRP